MPPSGSMPLRRRKEVVTALRREGNADTTQQQQQQQQYHRGESYERHNASAWDPALKPSLTLSDTPIAAAPRSAATSVSSSSASSPGGVNLIDFSPPNSPQPERQNLCQLHRAAWSSGTIPSLLDEPENEPKHDDTATQDNNDPSGDDAAPMQTSSLELELSEIGDEGDESTDDGYISSTESFWLASDDGDEKAANVMSTSARQSIVPASIPTDVDISFHPARPTQSLNIKQGQNSQYFATHFIDCEFEGLVTFENCLMINTVFERCIFKGPCRFTTVAFEDVNAVDCVFDDSWHDCRTFPAGDHIGEINIGDRAINHDRELPRAMTDTTRMWDQDYTHETWPAPADSSAQSQPPSTQASNLSPAPSTDSRPRVTLEPTTSMSPGASKDRLDLRVKRAQLASQDDPRCKPPAGVLESWKDEAKMNPRLFKPTVFVGQNWDDSDE